jgi:hypothetical protein
LQIQPKLPKKLNGEEEVSSSIGGPRLGGEVLAPPANNPKMDNSSDVGRNSLARAGSFPGVASNAPPIPGKGRYLIAPIVSPRTN